MKRPPLVGIVVASLLFGVALTSCGERNHQPIGTSSPAASPSKPGSANPDQSGSEGSATTAPPTTEEPSPISSGGAPAAGVPLDTPTSTTDTATTGTSTAIDAQVTAVYDKFLQDVAGLDANLNQSWLDSLEQVATPKFVHAAQQQADAISHAQEHSTGSLKDDHQVIKITSSVSVSIFDCLDEKDWYLVEDSNGEPDPGITRGDYVGIADMLLQNGRWYVDVWQPSQGACSF
jgi:hypothetical protein